MRRAAILLVLLALAACDSAGPSAYEEQAVVSSFLEVGKPIRPATLTRTFPLDGPIDLSRLLITDATVRVELLAADGSVEATFPFEYRTDGVNEGRYLPLDRDTPVLGARTYRFVADVPGFGEITAETTTPTAVELVEAADESIPYQQGFGPTFRVTPASVPGGQPVYLIEVAAEAADDYGVFERPDGSFGVRRLNLEGRFGPTPGAASFIEDISCDNLAVQSCDFDPADFAAGSSPLLNEETYTRFPDGSIEVTVPWLAFGFYGPHKFTLNALDPNLTEYLETQAVQFNPTTLSPGEIPNITSNVEGGLGIFGSFASVQVFSSIVP